MIPHTKPADPRPDVVPIPGMDVLPLKQQAGGGAPSFSEGGNMTEAGKIQAEMQSRSSAAVTNLLGTPRSMVNRTNAILARLIPSLPMTPKAEVFFAISLGVKMLFFVTRTPLKTSTLFSMDGC